MTVVFWILLVGVAFFTGTMLVHYFTAHPLKMSRYLLATCIGAFALLVILATGFAPGQLLLAIPAALGAFVLGYYLWTKRFLARDDEREVPAITRKKGDPGDGHTAVVYFTHGEPETYDPIGWINQFNEFDRQGIPFVPTLVRPYFVHKLRSAYMRIGRSEHRQMHLRMLKRLEQSYREQGDTTTKFYIGFLDDAPRPDAAVIQALNDGASHIIVCEVFLTISNHTAEGEELIEEVEVEHYGATIEFVGPMYDSETLKRLFVQRANAATGDTPKSEVGILLVGHGQPDEWDKEWGSLTKLEIAFRESILEMLAEDGYARENMSLSWMMFKEPKPGPKVEEYWSKGLKKVLYFPAAISADSMHSQFDIPDLIENANVPEDFPRINLRAWNDDPVVIQAIKEKIDTVKTSPVMISQDGQTPQAV